VNRFRSPEDADMKAALDERSVDLRPWLIVFLAFGIGWRLFRYALGMPIWGDEAYLGLNILQRSYGDLLHPLDFAQVAPILFLWAQRAVCGVLGMSEHAVRLLPLLASLAGLALFHFWSRLVVKPLAATLATAIVAVAYCVVHLSTEFKPYSLDFLAALALLLPATRYLLHPRKRELFLLVALLPLLLATSYPAVFVAGGVGLALLAEWRGRRPILRWLTLAYLATLVGVFCLLLRHLSDRQYGQTADYMITYWQDAFPPANPFHLALWLLKVHAGGFLAYPAGGKHCISILSFLLFAIGAFALLRRKTWPMRALLAGPFVLTFIAAALRRYPYGEDSRVSQHLAPAICLFIASGIAVLIDRYAPTPRRRRQAISATFLALLAVGLCGLTGNVLWPYHNQSAEQARDAVRGLFRRAQPAEAIVMLQPPSDIPANLLWYIHEHDSRVSWQDLRQLDARSLNAGNAGVWFVNCSDPASGRVAQQLERILGRPISGQQLRRFRSLPHRGLGPGIWQTIHFANGEAQQLQQATLAGTPG